MLIFLRHAQRGDNQFPNEHSQISYDPPVTTSSKSTIAKTAEEFLQIFKEQNITKVNIICSKFLRCLMTAEGVANIIEKQGIQVKRPYVIESKIGQYLREDWFKQYPLQNLIFDGEYRGKYIDQHRWKENKLEKKLPCPENYVMFHERIGRYKDEIEFPQKGEATLIVTHGFVVREMVWRMNQVPNIMKEVPYCGYGAFRNDGKQDYLLRAKL